MNKTDILELGKQYWLKTGERPKFDQWNKKTCGCSRYVLLKEFSKWSIFLTELEKYCEVDQYSFNNRTRITKEKALELGEIFYRKTGKLPISREWTVKENGCSYRNILELYSKWSLYIEELIDYCKISPSHLKVIKINNAQLTNRKTKWSEEIILQSLKDSASKNNGYPNYNDFINNPAYPSRQTISKVFGSWNSALIKAGIPIKKVAEVTPLGTLEEVIEKILQNLEYDKPKGKTDQDVVRLFCLGLVESKWDAKVAKNFTDQFTFKKLGSSYKSWMLKHHEVWLCPICKLVYAFSDFYSSKHLGYCKECSRNKKENKAKSALFRARKRNALVSWANKNVINEIYRKCPPGKHVDHIIPLRGKYVRGLHVETNLRYLDPKDNLSKSNYHISEEWWDENDPEAMSRGPKFQI